MKRLPASHNAHQESALDGDEEERRRHQVNVLPPSAMAAPQQRSPQPSQQNEDERTSRRNWLYGDSPADPPAQPEETTNQREEEPDAIATAFTSAHTVAEKTEHPESDAAFSAAVDCGPVVVYPLATNEAFFRPWKHNSSGSSSNNNSDSDACDDGEASTVNKWKVRALLNPFAKRKAAVKSKARETEQQPHAVHHADDDNDENPAVSSPARPAARTAIPRTPPSRRFSLENPPVSAPERPGTPVLAPAPVAIQPEPPTGLVSHPLRPPRGHVRSREAVGGLPHAPPFPLSDPPRFEDNADLPVALVNITGLRKSTAQLTPLHSTDRSVVRNNRPQNEDDSNAEGDDSVVGRVLKRLPPKPPTQLQQLKQQHQQAKQKSKKGATLDALDAIQRQREQRRNAQAEEKQRLKAEVEQHGDDAGYKFRRLIQKFRDALPAAQRSHQVQSEGYSGTTAAPSTQRLCVFVRKRPLAKKELKGKGYDVLTCLFTAISSKNNTLDTSLRRELLCHEPKLKVDCSEALENHTFAFDGVFDDDQDNETVYRATVGPLLPSLVPSTPPATSSSASSLTVFAYGQTGSGKTFTMRSIYRQAAADLFDRLAVYDCTVGVSVGVSFYEIYMNHVNDLLNLRKRVQLLEDGDGVVQLLGLKEIAIASADELMELIKIGEEARATSANAVHDDSSRSHALLRVTLSGADGAVLARLSLVDLAGSERACDTQSDSKSTRMEGAEINKSLLALKECVRALDRGATHIPFRQSKLTQLLRDRYSPPRSVEGSERLTHEFS
jgi:hypothetical protein